MGSRKQKRASRNALRALVELGDNRRRLMRPEEDLTCHNLLSPLCHNKDVDVTVFPDHLHCHVLLFRQPPSGGSEPSCRTGSYATSAAPGPPGSCSSCSPTSSKKAVPPWACCSLPGPAAACLGLLQLAWVAGVGPGERAPPVAEQLTFQQAVGQGRAGSELRMKERS